jgi:hypothetical protein
VTEQFGNELHLVEHHEAVAQPGQHEFGLSKAAPFAVDSRSMNTDLGYRAAMLRARVVLPT